MMSEHRMICSQGGDSQRATEGVVTLASLVMCAVIRCIRQYA
jgi:hypothetical protein